MMLPQSSLRGLPLLVAMALLTTAIGCGEAASETYPVRGKVVMPDGSVASSGLIEFRTVDAKGATVNAHSRIESDGTFELSTFGTKDGALAGKHQAILLSPAAGDGDTISQGPTFPQKYRSYESTDLEFEVKPGENNLEVRLK